MHLRVYAYVCILCIFICIYVYIYICICILMYRYIQSTLHRYRTRLVTRERGLLLIRELEGCPILYPLPFLGSYYFKLK